MTDGERTTQRIDALLAQWNTGDPADVLLRRRCALELHELRGLFRRHAAAFDEGAVAALKALGRALEETPSRSDRSTPAEVLSGVFGYDSFRPGQEEIIAAVLAGRDCVGVMPTGAGKSLTYQIPARVLGGTTLVVSPLISLMKDQVDAAREAGLAATFLNSTLDPEERRARLAGLRAGRFELVYAAPEGIDGAAGRFLGDVPFALLAIDEAHCISEWGHDFRPAYRNLQHLKQRFGGIPVLALTATATPEVVSDIVSQLGMSDPVKVRGSFFRSNLRLHAYRKGQGSVEVRHAILKLVRARPGESGIVYCLSRKSTEATARFLAENGVKALAYHAGLEAATRTRVQDAFRLDDVDVVCATIAFGMGIDKPNIRYVIHRDMPRSIEGYYQEIGRAGRDGHPSDCVLFFSYADVAAFDRFIDEAAAELAASQRRKVREMFRLAEGRTCRHRALVAYLGEKIADCRTSCDVCLGVDVVATAKAQPKKPVVETSSPTFLALKVLRRTLADARKVPAYLVFSDATLKAMAERHPLRQSELSAISGVGPKKLAAYGAQFLALLAELPRD